MELPTAIEKYWTQAAGVAAAIGALVKMWIDARAKKRTDAVAAAAARQVAKLDLARLAREAAAEIIQTLREEVDHWTAEVDKLRLELAEARREHARMIASKEAEISLRDARIRELEAKVGAYRRILLEHGWRDPEPLTFDALEVTADGHLKPMGDPG
ncbi:hypothetical protein [Caulobacter sp. Root1472]|uniref:hypothetical protein n=1 Tax=Caulobacter sp. Root1472 TaxID=1736470 RepID=UPI0006F69E32|nr:hypothetical protein [Caulobacter sp. Root1472]KQZ31736.1 hypothetical protein ASD47_15810 [Caulobacter sp. Root1472]